MAKTQVPKKARKRAKRPRPGRARRTLRLRTREAGIYLTRYKGKLRVLRIPCGGRMRANKLAAQKIYSALKIFHSLFPENSIRPVGISYIIPEGKQHRGEQHWGVVSDILRKRSPEYKEYQAWFYAGEINRHNTDERIKMRKEHHEFVYVIGTREAYQIERSSGISLNTRHVNVCNVEGKPVFFEIVKIDSAKLRQSIKANVKGRKQAELLRLLKKLPEIYKPESMG